MSELIVEVCEVLNVEPHPNADRMSVATIKGWKTCIRKDPETGISEFKVGDKCIYFPPDAVLPAKLANAPTDPIPGRLNVRNYCKELPKNEDGTRPDGCRVAAARLRGFPSYGFITAINPEFGDDPNWTVGTNIADHLGVTKWEPPVENTTGDMASPNPLFYKYTSIENYGNFPDLIPIDTIVVFTEKLHGCVSYDTKIALADGTTKTISEIVSKKLEVPVLGLDSNGSLVPTKILNWHLNGRTKDWYKLKISRNSISSGNHYRSITVTGNHEFFNPETKTYIRCDQLKVGSPVLMKRESKFITYFQKQVLIGKLLGDAHLSDNCLQFGHKKEHEEYLDYTLENLGSLAGNKQKEQLSGYGTRMVRGRTISLPSISEMFHDWNVAGKKQVPASIIGKLSPISLAFWYMDDGSLSHIEGQEDRISIAVCGFNDSSIEHLLKALQCLGIQASKKQYDYLRISINAEEADKFFSLIIPYVPKCM